jgi:uncharacterized protein (DUF427 family)
MAQTGPIVDGECDSGDVGRTVRVFWNGRVIANSLGREFLKDSPTTSVCFWKGMANCYTLEADGETNCDAVWHYVEPKNAKQLLNLPEKRCSQ